MKRKVIIYILKWYSNWLWLCCHLYLALWATRQTEETKGNRELHVKTTLRELIIYLVFLIILCVGKRDKRYHRHCMYQEKKPTQTNKKTIYLHKMKQKPLIVLLIFRTWKRSLCIFHELSTPKQQLSIHMKYWSLLFGVYCFIDWNFTSKLPVLI